MKIIKLYETVRVLYTLVGFLHAFVDDIQTCVIRSETNTLPYDSSYASIRMEAKQKCDDMQLILQHFDYSLNASVDSGSDKSTLNYTCCGESHYKEGELVSCKYVFTVRDNVCPGKNTQVAHIKNDCRRISNKSYPTMWEPHKGNFSCIFSSVPVRAFVCCEIASVSECVRGVGGCEVFNFTLKDKNVCYNAWGMRRVAHVQCHEHSKQLRSFKLEERCSGVKNGAPSGYRNITYACCPTTMKENTSIAMGPSSVCEVLQARYYCETDNPQYVCPSGRATEQNCSCFGEPDIAFVKYACCIELNICARIPSKAFPNRYYFNETLHNGSDTEYKVHCHKGSVSRVCTRNGLHARWGGERNNGCKIPDKCDRKPSGAFPHDYFFNETIHEGIDITSTVECHEGTLTRVCSKIGMKPVWGIEANNGCKTLEMTLNEAKNDTDIRKAMSSNEVNRVVEIVNRTVTMATKDTKIAGKMLSVIGNLMRMDNKIPLGGKTESGIQKITSIVEEFSSRLQISDNVSNVISTRDVTVGSYKIDRLTEPLVVQSYFQKNDTAANAEQINGPRVTIPHEVIQNLREKNDRIQIITYGNPMLFLNSKSMMYMIDNFYSVVTIIVDHETVFENNKTVIMYKIPRDENDSRSFTCVFWDKKTENWSRNGIDLITDKNGDETCRSTHLSSFFVLMDTDTDQRLSKDDERYLTYISYIGCGVSVVGLLATILTYALFKSLHGNASGQILLNICLSMLLLNLVFLLGSLDSETYDVGICMAVAISLHYLLLTTLLWMMIEALNMYQMLIVVFSERRRWFMRIRLLIGWGIPLGVVALTIAVSSDNYKPNKQFCFLSYTNRDAFIAAVLVPTCIILLVNTYVFIRVAIIVLHHSTFPNDSSGSASTVSLTQVRGAMSVMIILGVTWILGPLAIGPAKVVFAYMFTILNSIQGFLVFIFRCLFNREARASWRYLLITGKLKQTRGSFRPSSSSRWARSSQYAKKTMLDGSDTTFVSKDSFASHSISNSSNISSDARYASIAIMNHKEDGDDPQIDTNAGQPLRGLLLFGGQNKSQITQYSIRKALQDEELTNAKSIPVVRACGTSCVETCNYLIDSKRDNKTTNDQMIVASRSAIAAEKAAAKKRRKRHGHATHGISQGNKTGAKQTQTHDVIHILTHNKDPCRRN